MVIGAGFVAKRIVQRTARRMGVNERTASRLGNLTKWGVAVTTFDIASLVVDPIVDQIVDATADAVIDNIADALANGEYSGPDLVVGEDTTYNSTVEDTEFLEDYEAAYAEECPELADGDTRGYESGEEDDEATDAAKDLDLIQPYLEMAVAAYTSTSMSDELETVETSQLISNVTDPTHLFGAVGTTDTEVHVCILRDQSVVFAFRGTEPTEWRNGFADVLTDLAQGQDYVKLYDGSSTPAYTSCPLIKVHRGFQLALKDVTDTSIPSQNLRLVLQELGMQAEDVGSVVCVGHSLGGALATLCAKWCREVAFPGAEIGCVTIGSPRVGNVAFAADFNSRVVDGINYRVVNKRDIVPCIPNLMTYPALGSAYKHVGQPIYLCENEVGELSSRLGGSRPTSINLNFFDHRRISYLESVKAVLQAA